MDLWVNVAIYVALLLVLIFSGMPIVFALGVIAVGSVYFGFGSELLLGIAYVTWTSMASFTICAIPLFILMGNILFESGLSTRVYSGISPLLDRLLPGSILHTNIAAGAVFASACGSTLATCATIGQIALPEMERRGYARGIAAGSVAAGGTLGGLIPPSIAFIVYGAMTNVSIGRLFIGGIIPGIVLAALYMSYIAIRLKIQPNLAPDIEESQKRSWQHALRGIFNIWPILFIVAGVIGSMYAGIATATEAAAIGVGVTLTAASIYRSLNWVTLKKSVIGAVRTTGMVLAIYLSANLMGVYLSNSGITTGLARAVASLPFSPHIIFGGIILFYVILGMLMDGLAAMVITLPIIFPIVTGLGFDPVWFGVALTMIAECSLLTPPVGLNLFILQGLRPDYPFSQIVKGCMPFFLVLMIAIVLVTAFPQLITFLPQTMMG